MAGSRTRVTTLSIDVGGTGLKASVLDERGRMLVDRVRVETPVGSPPGVVVTALRRLVAPLPHYHRVSVGFPGVVRDGVVRTAPNLGHTGWQGYDLARALQRALGRPVRVINDADMQGLAAIRGKGLELVLTLGTGFGSALYIHGRLAPHLELAHVPFRKGETFEQQLGNAARKQAGARAWNRRVRKALDVLFTLTQYDRAYLGGGNSKHLQGKLPRNTSIVPNEKGILGGIHLWREGVAL
ncbi:MAG: ROK family protein [Deltaproteobacteria bacterium]|nr:ROK family protein [Deltaproteobacteria bacterium]